MAAIVAKGETRFRGYLSGGPELMAWLNRLGIDVRQSIAKAAVQAGAQAIAEEWALRTPVGTPPHDPHPGAYQRAMQSPAIKVANTAKGAQGTIRPGHLDDLPANEQPEIYSVWLEWIHGDPAARPAMDAAKDKVPDMMGEVIRNGLVRSI